MYLMTCVLFFIVFDYISADLKVITEVSFNISLNNNIPTCKNNPIRGLVAQQRFRVSAASNDKEFTGKVATCSFNNTTQNPIRLKLEDNEHLFVTSDELYFKPEMDGHQLICELGLNMSQNSHNNNNLTPDTHNRRSSSATCVIDIHLEITNVSFNISMEGNIPTCTKNPVSGPVIAEQKFQVSATTKDKQFAYNTTTCFFNNSPQNPIHLKLQNENNQFVRSDELYFKPKMDGHQLICVLGLQIERNAVINNSEALVSHDRRNSTATCVVMTIHLLGTAGSIENNEIDYKTLMIIGFSLAIVFLIICLAQSVALCICVPKGRFRKKKGERTNTNSIISDSGSIYEELRPIPKYIETVTVDESDKQPGKCLTIDPPRPEKNGKKGIKAIFARSPKSHPPPVAESTVLEVNASSARPHVFKEEIYSNEYVPAPTSIDIKPLPRPPKPKNLLKRPVAKKRIRQQKLEGNCPYPVKSSKRISEMVSKFEGHLQPALASKVPITSVLKPKKNFVTSEQCVPVQHHAWSPQPRTPVILTQHHFEDDRMDSEDSEDWTYEDLEEIYEMPEALISKNLGPI